jgi:hypothetical protein
LPAFNIHISNTIQIYESIKKKLNVKINIGNCLFFSREIPKISLN